MTTNFKMTKENKFNLRLLVKRCGLKYKDVSTLIGESRQTVCSDFRGNKISTYRTICYELLLGFLEELRTKGEIFEKEEDESRGSAAARRKEFVLTLREEFLDALKERVINASNST